MLLFKKKFIDLIRSGEKTQTLRIWPCRRMREGQRSYIPGVGYILVEAVDDIVVAALTEADARLDGFASLGECLSELNALYTNMPDDEHRLYRVRFRLLDDDEQQLAIKEREQRRAKTLS